MNVQVQLLPPDAEEERECWVAVCPEIDLATQGDTSDEAVANIRDAFSAWTGTCIRRGTLDAALEECGFSRSRIEEFRKDLRSEMP